MVTGVSLFTHRGTIVATLLDLRVRQNGTIVCPGLHNFKP